MAYDHIIEQSIDTSISSWDNIEKKKMFGGVCYLVNGNICFGIIDDLIIVRTGVEAAREKMKEKNVKPFDITGRPMRGWIMVERQGWKDKTELEQWLTTGRDFASALPRK